MLAEGEKVIKIEWFCLCEAFVTMLTVISTLGTSSCMGSTDVSPSPSDTRLFGSGETSHPPISGTTAVFSLLMKQVGFTDPSLQAKTEILICKAFQETKDDLQCQGGYLSCRLGNALIRSG